MTSVYNFQHMAFGNDKGHGSSIIQRNERFPGMSALGFNAEYMYIHTAKDLRKIITYMEASLEDGKQGAYIHTGTKMIQDPLTRRTVYKIKKTPTVCHGWNMHNNSQFYCIETHDSFLKLLFFRLTQKTYESSQRMQVIQPELCNTKPLN